MSKIMNTKLIVIHFLYDLLSIFGMGVALFWSAGRLDWWAAWAAIAVMLVCIPGIDIVIIRFQPDLLIERMYPPKGAIAWDRAILSFIRLTQLARYILAGLDQRYGWTGGFPLAAQVVAIPVCVLGYALLGWALASNNFFSQIVRIQSDRGHAVMTGGPYRYVRHPGYAGMIVFEVAMSILVDSWWAFVAGGLCALLWLLRTALEDRVLQAELDGYVGYAHGVRYRLLPGIW
jgi:protein-S-isoprenylcysteine O-methyltransferase Ste14